MLSPLSESGPMPILTVSQVTQAIKETLEDTYPALWVEGEISNLRIVQSGHAYFTLKDARSQMRVVMFRSALRQLPFTPEAGMQIVARGHLTVYEPRGDYQLLAEALEPKGIGALQLAYEQLKERLYQEGLFDEARKRPLPLMPQRIGIVTSPTGAAIRDIIHVAHRRMANVHLYVYPVRVQGKEAVPEIVQGIAALNIFYPPLDVLIVTRGGGSLEDLWAFNEEAVAWAIAGSEIPVISAVGHEIDYTIADFVADLRAPTPSAAAELVVRSAAELQQQVAALLARMYTVVQQTCRRARAAYERLAAARVLRDSGRLIETRLQQVDDLRLQFDKAWDSSLHERLKRWQTADRNLARLTPRLRWQRQRAHLQTLQRRLETAMHSRLVLRQEMLNGIGGTLHSLSPLAVLGRGYSLCRNPITKHLITRVAPLSPGQSVEVLLQDGHLNCLVSTIERGETANGQSDLRAGPETS